MTKNTQHICQIVKGVVGKDNDWVLLHSPYIPPDTWENIDQCLRAGWISSTGNRVEEFEKKLSAVVDGRHSIAVSSGTAALQVCLHLGGVTENSEVLVPSLTFVATANAITFCGGIPHFIDIDSKTLSMSPDTLESTLRKVARKDKSGRLTNSLTGRRISAVCVMHCLGHPANLDCIIKICNKYDLALIEDAAQSLGSLYKERKAGTFGVCSAISFNGNKIISTGGGGAIVTQNEALAEKARHLTTTAKINHPWEIRHDAIGWNFRMPNVNAAIGVAQIASMDHIMAAKRALAMDYKSHFTGENGVQFIDEPSDCRSNFWLNAIRLPGLDFETRELILAELHQNKIQARPLWYPLHLQDIYSKCPRANLENTETAYKEVICLPSSPTLRIKQVLANGSH